MSDSDAAPAVETEQPEEAPKSEGSAAPEPKTVAAASVQEEASAPDEPQEYWPSDWREKVAEHQSAGNKQAYDRELKRLQRFKDPAGVYGMGRELESKFSDGGLTKIPGKDATEEDISSFWKQLGVPEKAEDYLDSLDLPNNATLGEHDIPVAKEFAEFMHKANATPDQMSAAFNWYFNNLEREQAEMEASDDESFYETQAALRERHGASLDRQMNSLPTLFADLPGGADLSNPDSVWSRLIGGRTSDGRLIGNDPDILGALISWNRQINPVATVTEYGQDSSRSVDQELSEIRKLMREDRRAYNQDTAIQERYRELLEAQSARGSR